MVVFVMALGGGYFLQPSVLREQRLTISDWLHQGFRESAYTVPSPGDINRLRMQTRLSPVAQYQLREFLAAWRLRDRFPGVWNSLVQRWGRVTGASVSDYEAEAWAWDKDWSEARARTRQLELRLSPVSGQGVEVEFPPTQRTADVGTCIRVDLSHPPGTTVITDPALFWTTAGQPEPDARRRIRGQIEMSSDGTSRTVTFDLSTEPGWKNPSAQPRRLCVRIRLSQQWKLVALTAGD